MVLVDGGFLVGNVQLNTADETNIVTVTKSLIFTRIISFHYGLAPNNAGRRPDREVNAGSNQPGPRSGRSDRWTDCICCCECCDCDDCCCAGS